MNTAVAYLRLLAFFITNPMAARATLLTESLNSHPDPGPTNDHREERTA